MLKSNQPVSVKGVAALGAIVTLAALTARQTVMAALRRLL